MTIDESIRLVRSEEELYFRATGDKKSPVFIKDVTAAIPFIARFCSVYGVCLSGVDVTNEAGGFEPAYMFTDNLGCYTLEGVLNSLDDF